MTMPTNPLLRRALEAHDAYQLEVEARRQQAQDEWIQRAIAKTVESANRVLDWELEPEDVEYKLLHRTQSVQCKFTIFGETLDLEFATFTEENAYNCTKAQLHLTSRASNARINDLAELGAELRRLGYGTDPTAAPETTPGA